MTLLTWIAAVLACIFAWVALIAAFSAAKSRRDCRRWMRQSTADYAKAEHQTPQGPARRRRPS